MAGNLLRRYAPRETISRREVLGYVQKITRLEYEGFSNRVLCRFFIWRNSRLHSGDDGGSRFGRPVCTQSGSRAAMPAASNPTPGPANLRPNNPMARTPPAEMKARATRWASMDRMWTRSKAASTKENTGGCTAVGTSGPMPRNRAT